MKLKTVNQLIDEISKLKTNEINSDVAEIRQKLIDLKSKSKYNVGLIKVKNTADIQKRIGMSKLLAQHRHNVETAEMQRNTEMAVKF